MAALKPLLAPVRQEKICERGRAIGLPRLHLKAQFVRTDEALGFCARRRVGDGLIVGPVERGEEQLELQCFLRAPELVPHFND